jgi:hypothetical protein
MALMINGFPVNRNGVVPLPTLEKGKKLEFEIEMIEDPGFPVGSIGLWLRAQVGTRIIALEQDTVAFSASPTKVTIKSRAEVDDEGILAIAINNTVGVPLGTTDQYAIIAGIVEAATPSPASADPDEPEEEPVAKQPLSTFAKRWISIGLAAALLLLGIGTWMTVDFAYGGAGFIKDVGEETLKHATVNTEDVIVTNPSDASAISPEVLPDGTPTAVAAPH